MDNWLVKFDVIVVCMLDCDIMLLVGILSWVLILVEMLCVKV